MLCAALEGGNQGFGYPHDAYATLPTYYSYHDAWKSSLEDIYPCSYARQVLLPTHPTLYLYEEV